MDFGSLAMIFNMHENLFYHYPLRTMCVCKFPQSHTYPIKVITVMVDAQIHFYKHKRPLLLIFTFSSSLRDLFKGLILAKKHTFLAKNAHFFSFEGVCRPKNASVVLKNTFNVLSDPKLTWKYEGLTRNALLSILCLIR